MSLPQQEIERYQTEGYAVAKTFFSEREIQAMRAELERFKREGMLRNVATDGDGATHSTKVENLQICPIGPRSDFYRALPFHPRLKEAVGSLIGRPFAFRLDQIFLKPGGRGAGTGWHQDNAYFKITDPSKGVGVWTAIHAATIANGTLHIVPGSHRQAIPHSRDPNSDHHIHCIVDESRAVPVELPAGGVVFFNFGIAHSTRINTTDSERAGLALHFVHLSQLEGNDQMSGVIMVDAPDATGGEKEYGVRVEGTWEQQVNRVLQEQVEA